MSAHGQVAATLRNRIADGEMALRAVEGERITLSIKETLAKAQIHDATIALHALIAYDDRERIA